MGIDMFKRVRKIASVYRAFEDNLYEIALAEVEGANINRSTWARAIAKSNGSEGDIVAKYIAIRVRELKEAVRNEYDNRTNTPQITSRQPSKPSRPTQEHSTVCYDGLTNEDKIILERKEFMKKMELERTARKLSGDYQPLNELTSIDYRAIDESNGKEDFVDSTLAKMDWSFGGNKKK